MEVTDKRNSHTIPFSFFKEYVERENKSLEFLEGKLQIIEFDYYKMMWEKSSVITVADVRELLHKFGLDYDMFINKYCDYLKTVNF